MISDSATLDVPIETLRKEKRLSKNRLMLVFQNQIMIGEND